MNAKLVLAICGCALAGALVFSTAGRVEAQNAEAPVRPIKLSATGTGAIWGDEQNVFVLVGDRLFKVRKYDMKVDRTVALRTTSTTTSTAAQQIVHKTAKKVKPKPVASDEE